MRFVALFLSFLLMAGLIYAAPPSDDRIYDEVRRKLANDPDVKGGAFEVDVKDGVVTVKGAVDKQKFVEKAAKLAKKVKGVKSVVNHVTVKKP